MKPIKLEVDEKGELILIQNGERKILKNKSATKQILKDLGIKD